MAAGFPASYGGFTIPGGRNIYLNSDQSVLNRTLSTDWGYQGTNDQLQFAVFYEEGIELMGISQAWVSSNNPNPLRYGPGALEQAASEMLTDNFLTSVGEPARFPGFAGKSFTEYLRKSPPGSRKQAVTPAAAAIMGTLPRSLIQSKTENPKSKIRSQGPEVGHEVRPTNRRKVEAGQTSRRNAPLGDGRATSGGGFDTPIRTPPVRPR